MCEPWNNPVKLDIAAGEALIDSARLAATNPSLARLRAADSEALLARAARIRAASRTNFQPPESCPCQTFSILAKS